MWQERYAQTGTWRRVVKWLIAEAEGLCEAAAEVEAAAARIAEE